MADSREWYVLDPDNTGTEYPNLESADAGARSLAAGGGVDGVTIVRCTSVPVRRYWRETKVVSEEINPLA